MARIRNITGIQATRDLQLPTHMSSFFYFHHDDKEKMEDWMRMNDSHLWHREEGPDYVLFIKCSENVCILTENNGMHTHASGILCIAQKQLRDAIDSSKSANAIQLANKTLERARTCSAKEYISNASMNYQLRSPNHNKLDKTYFDLEYARNDPPKRIKTSGEMNEATKFSEREELKENNLLSHQKIIGHEGFQLLEKKLQICENDSLNVQTLSKVLQTGCWISLSGCYEKVGFVFDIGRIEAIRFHKRKSKSICTAKIHFPFYCENEESKNGTTSLHEIKSSAYNNDPSLTPNRNGLWRLLEPRLDHIHKNN